MNYTSCNWLLHGLNFEMGHIEMCCLRCHIGEGHVILKNPYNGELLDWDKFFEVKQKFINQNKDGAIDSRCEGCFNLENKDWDDSQRYFSFIHFNHWTRCNCDCMYCYTTFQKEFFNKRPHYNVLPIIKDLFAHNLFRPGGEITFAGGEPTILEEFEDLMNFLVDNNARNITVHTSGVKYSKALARAVKEGAAKVVISADAGTRETYKKIKRFDHFKKVWENAKKYAEAQTNDNTLVSTKYILQADVNDNFEEIEKWMRLNEKSKVKAIIIDIEYEWFKVQREQQSMPHHIIEQIKYMHKRAADTGMKVTLYNGARYLDENKEYFTNNIKYPNPYLKNV